MSYRVPYSVCRTVVATVLAVAGATAVSAAGEPRPAPPDNPFRHVEALQELAMANGGNRAAGTPGYDRSADYVAEQLRSAGYRVRFEEFSFPFFQERSAPLLMSEPGGPDPLAPVTESLRILRYSGSGDVTARLQPVDLNLGDPARTSTSGCERDDFASFNPGSIALVRRGTCPFQTKVENAHAAGAAGVVIMNQGTEGQTGPFSGSLANSATIPVLGLASDFGAGLESAARRPEGVRVRLKVDVESGTRTTRNVIAERETITRPFVVVGAHLDSVPEGPGMNDNASGSAAVLETALRLIREPSTDLPIRFAFWGAEERGLLGSRHHLDAMPEEERRRIGLYLNLDMVGSPNYGRFIQLTQEPRSALVDSVTGALSVYLEQRKLSVDERAGRRRGFGSDDASFASKDIPTIGLYTGAGEPKSELHAQRFGGSAGQPFDPCYHKACDTAANVNQDVLGQITEALTHALSQIKAPERTPG